MWVPQHGQAARPDRPNEAHLAESTTRVVEPGLVYKGASKRADKAHLADDVDRGVR